MTFVFNKKYDDKEQVREFMPAFLARFAEVDPTLRFAYNDQFKGHVAGIEGESEDSAIYLLQTLKRMDALKTRVAEHLEAGFFPVEGVTQPTKYNRVIHYQDAGGWQEWEAARIIPFGRGMAVLPKGKRTHGYLLSGKVLAR